MSEPEARGGLADAELPGAGPANGNVFIRYFKRFDDGEVLRWAFRGLLVGAIGVLALDLRDMAADNARLAPLATPSDITEPLLPPTVKTNAPLPPSDPRKFVTADEAALRQKISFTLAAGGVLQAQGTIDAGAAARFTAEIAERGEYVKIIALNSPGGSLVDALAMAALIREKGLSTEVLDGALCASSCPLVLSGGSKRLAGTNAAIGVHQFYAVGPDAPDAVQAMSDAQATTARISRHLTDMGVDPDLWLHALDTPPQALYYFSPDELAKYKLVTGKAATPK